MNIYTEFSNTFFKDKFKPESETVWIAACWPTFQQPSHVIVLTRTVTLLIANKWRRKKRKSFILTKTLVVN